MAYRPDEDDGGYPCSHRRFGDSNVWSPKNGEQQGADGFPKVTAVPGAKRATIEDAVGALIRKNTMRMIILSVLATEGESKSRAMR